MKILGRALLVTGRAIYRVDDRGHVDFVFLLFSSLIDRPISDLAYWLWAWDTVNIFTWVYNCHNPSLQNLWEQWFNYICPGMRQCWSNFMVIRTGPWPYRRKSVRQILTIGLRRYRYCDHKNRKLLPVTVHYVHVIKYMVAWDQRESIKLHGLW